LFIFRKNIHSVYDLPSAALIKEMVDAGRWRLWLNNKDVQVYAADVFSPRIEAKNFDVGIDKQHHIVVEYKKLSHTNYVARVHGIRGPFNLSLGQSFSSHWVLSTTKIPIMATSELNNGILLPVADMGATREDLDSFVANGWISLPESPPVDQMQDSYKEYRYISKLIKNSIQNDNLPEPGRDFFKRLFGDPNRLLQHGSLNGMDNVWVIDPSEVCGRSAHCEQKGDGSFQMDFIIEYVPQHVFYFGGILSVSFYLLLLSYLIYCGLLSLGKGRWFPRLKNS